MNAFLETRKIFITPLSPVHIGCGLDYEPTNYVIDGGKLYYFEPEALLDQLSAQEHRELLLAAEDLRRVQRYIFERRDKAIQVARFAVPVPESVQTFYQSRIGQVVQREPGSEVLNKLEIARTAFNPFTLDPILPGSSLKGAIRTAILEALRREKGKEFPLPSPEDNRSSDQIARQMEQTLLGGSFHSDPMRFIKVSDASFRIGNVKLRTRQQGTAELVEQIVPRRPRSIMFACNRSKEEPKQTNQPYQLLECVPNGPMQQRAFGAVIELERKPWSPQFGNDDLPRLQFDWQKILQACNDFYLAHLKKELEIYGDILDKKWADTANHLLSQYRQSPYARLIAEGKAFVLRVGRHSGAESVTVDAPRQILIRGKTKRYLPEPTTAWFSATSHQAATQLLPFGWVLVEWQTEP